VESIEFSGMDSGGIGGIEISSSTEPDSSNNNTSTSGIAFSPRSGKVVRYCNEKR
jgi:hypothetical protein